MSKAVVPRFKALRGLSRKHVYFILVCMALTALVLAAMGRSWWCSAGDWSLWAGGVESRHNSQHVFDPYTLTHVLHGLGFYLLIYWILRRFLDPARRFTTAIVLECGWEILENSNFIIGRYREDTIALGYFGDSIINSMADILACAIGYLLASILPILGSLLLFILIEALLLWWIRDSLLLNILMLLWPLEAVKQWQNAGLFAVARELRFKPTRGEKSQDSSFKPRIKPTLKHPTAPSELEERDALQR